MKFRFLHIIIFIIIVALGFFFFSLSAPKSYRSKLVKPIIYRANDTIEFKIKKIVSSKSLETFSYHQLPFSCKDIKDHTLYLNNITFLIDNIYSIEIPENCNQTQLSNNTLVYKYLIDKNYKVQYEVDRYQYLSDFGYSYVDDDGVRQYYFNFITFNISVKKISVDGQFNIVGLKEAYTTPIRYNDTYRYDEFGYGIIFNETDSPNWNSRWKNNLVSIVPTVKSTIVASGLSLIVKVVLTIWSMRIYLTIYKTDTIKDLSEQSYSRVYPSKKTIPLITFIESFGSNQLFITPPHPIVFSSLVGGGISLAFALFIAIVVANFLPPYYLVTSTVNYFIYTYILSGIISGYVSNYVYKMISYNNDINLKVLFLNTSVPAIFLGLYSFLTVVRKSPNIGPAYVVLMMIGIQLPLSIVGFFISHFECKNNGFKRFVLSDNDEPIFNNHNENQDDQVLEIHEQPSDQPPNPPPPPPNPPPPPPPPPNPLPSLLPIQPITLCPTPGYEVYIRHIIGYIILSMTIIFCVDLISQKNVSEIQYFSDIYQFNVLYFIILVAICIMVHIIIINGLLKSGIYNWHWIPFKFSCFLAIIILIMDSMVFIVTFNDKRSVLIFYTIFFLRALAIVLIYGSIGFLTSYYLINILFSDKIICKPFTGKPIKLKSLDPVIDITISEIYQESSNIGNNDNINQNRIQDIEGDGNASIDGRISIDNQ